MKLLPDISFEKYNDVPFILEYLRNNPQIGNEDVEPIQYFHCFWKGSVSDLHLMCLESLNETHPNCTVLFWTPNLLEVQGSYSWIKIKRLFKDRIKLQEVTYEHFKEAGASLFYSIYSMQVNFKSVNIYQFEEYKKIYPNKSDDELAYLIIQENEKNYKADLAYASDIIRFVTLYLYGGVWFDMDILFLRNFDSIKMKRFVSQWGTDPCGNAAILKLEKGHDLIQKFKNYPKTFYPTSSFKLENDIDLTIIPSTFFDIHWQGPNEFVSFQNWDEFFQQEELNLPKEIYAYHWHNRWEKTPPPFYQKLKLGINALN